MESAITSTSDLVETILIVLVGSAKYICTKLGRDLPDCQTLCPPGPGVKITAEKLPEIYKAIIDDVNRMQYLGWQSALKDLAIAHKDISKVVGDRQTPLSDRASWDDIDESVKKHISDIGTVTGIAAFLDWHGKHQDDKQNEQAIEEFTTMKQICSVRNFVVPICVLDLCQ